MTLRTNAEVLRRAWCKAEPIGARVEQVAVKLDLSLSWF